MLFICLTTKRAVGVFWYTHFSLQTIGIFFITSKFSLRFLCWFLYFS